MSAGPGSIALGGRGWLQFGQSGAPPTPAPPLTNLAAWWRSDGPGNRRFGQIATLIADQSGFGNDATVSAGFVGPEIDPNVVNHLPGMNCFYDPSVQMGGAGQLLPDGSRYYLASIGRMSPVSAGPSPGGFVTGGGLANFGLTGPLDVVFGDFGGDVYFTPSIIGAGVPIARDGIYFWEMGSDGATLSASIVGTPVLLSSTAPSPPTGAGWNILADVTGNGPFWGWWVETLLYSEPPAPAELAQLSTYLHYRSGV